MALAVNRGLSKLTNLPLGRQLVFETPDRKLTHNVFRYPAKFHPPVARALIEQFTEKGDTIVDPFCGSGTLMVEAAVLGRSAVGTDVDPLAVMIAEAKTTLYELTAIRTIQSDLSKSLLEHRNSDLDKWGDFSKDISEDEYEKAVAPYKELLPAIPRIEHWFRKRVRVQLVVIRSLLEEIVDPVSLLFFRLCFATIIRNSSNADPVPVSGLEVTSHMLRKEAAGREIDPYKLFLRAVDKAIQAAAEYNEFLVRDTKIRTYQKDARTPFDPSEGNFDAAITSPPYLTAVDYYRRHTLEVYWLGLVDDSGERLALLPKYIGRDRVAAKYLPDIDHNLSDLIDRWMLRFPKASKERQAAFKHYCEGMRRSLKCTANSVSNDAPIIVVAGDVTFCGQRVSMLELMRDLSMDFLELNDHLKYPIVNRYMSYTRRNEANIATDHVLVFKKNGV